ncbi:MAG: hypothetical protein U1F57_00130 [bacterium]
MVNLRFSASVDSSEFSPTGGSILSRFSESRLNSAASLSAFQSQVDGLVGAFAEQASDWRSLTAMAAGSLFYRLGRLGTLALASKAGIAAPLFHAASYGIGLASEVTAYQTVSDTLSPVSPLGRYDERWRTSFVQFALLKIGGAGAARQNLLVQHLLQDSAMVAGHQVTGRLGWTPAPEGNLAEQFLHAEATNLQLAAGMGLMHGMIPELVSWERSLDLSLHSSRLPMRIFDIDRSDWFSLSFAYETGGTENLPRSERFEEPLDLSKPVFMQGIDGEGGGAPSSNGASLSPEIKAYRRELSRVLSQNIERMRHSWLGVMVPPGLEKTSMMDIVIRRAQEQFGEKLLQVVVLSSGTMSSLQIRETLTREFGDGNVGPFDPSARRQKQMTVGRVSDVLSNLNSLPRERSILFLLEDATQVSEQEVRSLLTHFRFAQERSGGLTPRKGNGVVIGLSETKEGLSGYRLSSPVALPTLSRPPQPSSPRPAIPPERSVREKVPVPVIPPPPALPTMKARPPARPLPPPPVSGVSGEDRVITVRENRHPRSSRKIQTVKPLEEKTRRMIEVFGDTMREMARERQGGASVNPFLWGLKAYRAYIASADSRISEGAFYNHVARYSEDPEILAFLAEIGVHRR